MDKGSILVVDNFIPDFNVVKEVIKDVKYGDHEFMGKNYTGWGSVTLPLKMLIEKKLGFPVAVYQSHLRMGRMDTPLTHYIHADNAGAEFGLVYYLSVPDCRTGTAFWRHKELGLQACPDDCDDELFSRLDADIRDPSLWEMTGFVDAKENRALFFDSSMFHSRWPEVIPVAVGDKPRLVSTTFFNRLPL